MLLIQTRFSFRITFFWRKENSTWRLPRTKDKTLLKRAENICAAKIELSRYIYSLLTEHEEETFHRKWKTKFSSKQIKFFYELATLRVTYYNIYNKQFMEIFSDKRVKNLKNHIIGIFNKICSIICCYIIFISIIIIFIF